MALLLFGIPAALIANGRGFAPWRWLLALGVIGLVVVCCLPSAKARDLDPETAAARKARGDAWGAWLAWISVGITLVALLASLASL